MDPIPSIPFQGWSGYRVNTMIITLQGVKTLQGNPFQVNPDLHVFRVDFIPYNTAAQTNAIRIRKDGQAVGQGTTVPANGLSFWNDARLARRDQYKVDFAAATEELTVIQHYLEKVTHAV